MSVVIPAYNAAAFLAEALTSVRSQEVDLDIETIVVDDCSDDLTAEVARSARPDTLIRRETNGGIGAARNTGVAAATGEYLAFLDADDLWPAGSLSARFAVLIETGAGAAFGRVQQFGEHHRPEPPAVAYLAGAMLITREAFQAVGPFDPTVAVGEFVDWFARAQESRLPVAMTSEVALLRRIHTTNTGIVRRDQAVDYTRVLRRALERRREAGRP